MHRYNCKIIHGETTLGDVILYRHSVTHMGSKNRASEFGHNRTVVDLSYMFPGNLQEDQFIFKSKFPPAAYKAINQYRKRNSQLCLADGLKCAPTSIATSDLGEGPAYVTLRGGEQKEKEDVGERGESPRDRERKKERARARESEREIERERKRERERERERDNNERMHLSTCVHSGEQLFVFVSVDDDHSTQQTPYTPRRPRLPSSSLSMSLDVSRCLSFKV